MITLTTFLRTISNGSDRIILITKSIKDVLVQKWLIALVMTLALTFILSPQGYLVPATYREGAIAGKNIKADREFLVEDVVSTEQRRQKALLNAQEVYDLDRGISSTVGKSLSQTFPLIAESIAKTSIQETAGEKALQLKKIRVDMEASLGVTLSEKEWTFLAKRGFPSEAADLAAAILAIAYEGKYVLAGELSPHAREIGILLRDITTQELKELTDFKQVKTVEAVRRSIEAEKDRIPGDRDKEIVDVALSLAKKLVRPNITFAKNATEQNKIAILEGIKAVFYKVQKNEMIVREGEKITKADIDKLDALFEGQGDSWFLRSTAFLGMFLTILTFSLVLYPLPRYFLKTFENTNIDMLFLALTAVFQVFFLKAGLFVCESIHTSFPSLSSESCLNAIPFTMGAILVTVLINRNVGLVFAIFVSTLTFFLFEDKVSVFLYSLMGNFVAAYHIARCRQRSMFFKTGALVGLVNITVTICIALLHGQFSDPQLPVKLLMGLLGGLIAGVFVSGLIPLFEFLFGYITDIRLLEHANLNQSIFQEMIIAAPGTYHHSVIVASMSEAAAEAIGANSLLAKVSAYYHDIGKMKKPIYFIENQHGWENKHDSLTPKMSSLVIISHVKDGIELARKHKLGRAITDIIRQHHGARIVNFFYEKAKKEAKTNGQKILESDFRYPGPRPQTKEAGIVLLADVIEATARTLKDPAPSRIKNLVEERVRLIVNEGELDESDLTFRDLSKIMESFTRILTGIFHHRIDYPEQPGNGSVEAVVTALKHGSSRKKSATHS